MYEDSLIINPQTGDTASAREVLSEIREVLAKRGYALIIDDGSRTLEGGPVGQPAIVLMKLLNDGTMRGRAVAFVKQINPQSFDYKPIDWSGEFLKKGNT